MSALLFLAAAAVPAAAQEYPIRPLRMIVPFPVGAGTDVLAREVSAYLSKIWGQPVVVENRAGAGGTIGAEAGAKAPPDGYTILMGNVSTLAIAPALYANLPYDPLKAFDPVALVGSNVNVLLVNAALQPKTLGELVAFAQANPGKLLYSSAGSGTTGHLAGELFRLTARIDIRHVPYKGSPQATTDLLGGQVHLSFAPVNVAVTILSSGKVRALATTGLARSPVLPDLPTFDELGYKDFEVNIWQGFVVPAGTPRPIIAKLNQGINQAAQSEEIRTRMMALGSTLRTSTPEEFAAYMKAEIVKWGDLVRRSGAKVD
jgi:tripartite-type tricarboxylate transporter receptor subunit TctC